MIDNVTFHNQAFLTFSHPGCINNRVKRLMCVKCDLQCFYHQSVYALQKYLKEELHKFKHNLKVILYVPNSEVSNQDRFKLDKIYYNYGIIYQNPKQTTSNILQHDLTLLHPTPNLKQFATSTFFYPLRQFVNNYSSLKTAVKS